MTLLPEAAAGSGRSDDASQVAARPLLHQLLPRFYWPSDERSGDALAALLDAIASQYDGLRDQVRTLYDDVFLETCAPELVPYFADELGVVGMSSLEAPGLSLRAWVGHALGFRRRRGTLGALAHAAAIGTGWAVFVREGIGAASRTQAVRYVDTAAGRLVDVSDGEALRELAEPWSPFGRTVGLRGWPSGAGFPLPPARGPRAGGPSPRSVALDVWRVPSYPVAGRSARAVPASAGGAPGAFTFDPLGLDVPLYQPGSAGAPAGAPPAGSEIPRPLTVAALRASLARGEEPPFSLTADGTPVAAERLAATDLSAWSVPPAAAGAGGTVLVDPERGRFLFAGAPPPAAVSVDYWYGFPGEIGAGPYPVVAAWQAAPPGVEHEPLEELAAEPQSLAARFAAATDGLRRRRGEAWVRVAGSRTYDAGESPLQLRLEAGQTVRVVAAPGATPVVTGTLGVVLGDEGGAGARVEIVGLTVEGSIVVEGAGTFSLESCTLVSRAGPSLVVRPAGPGSLAGSVAACILGTVAAAGTHLSLRSSIVDGGGRQAIGARGTPVEQLEVRDTTVLGETFARRLVAEGAIFTGPVTVEETGMGGVRHCYLAPGSVTPMAIACEPARSTRGVEDAGARSRAEAELRPVFTSTRLGDPAYCQLSPACSPAVRTGGVLGRELGAFAELEQPAREERLLQIVRDYLPAGLSAEIRVRS